MSQPESDDKQDIPPEGLEEINTPEPKAPPDTAEAVLEVLLNQKKAYEDSLMTLTAKRNQVNASIKHRRAQLDTVEDLLRKLKKHAD